MRRPIVTILGHVDHGKTTLLDVIRKSSIAEREAGGITQSVGASSVETSSGAITFIDTPGHAAFTSMREHGAQVADIVVLTVAADDGVMPQTREALGYLHETQTPYVVAITKIDLAAANVERTLGSLEKEEVLLEGRGGNVPYVAVSAKQNRGVDELLEMIDLLYEVTKKPPTDRLEAYVVEAAKEKSGVTALVAVKNGTLAVGQTVSAGGASVKVRGVFNEVGKPIKSASAGEVVKVLGFSQIPEVGARIEPDRGVKQIAEASKFKPSESKDDADEELFRLLIRADTSGALDALKKSLPEDAKIINASAGKISENDIFIAKNTGAEILTFGLKTSARSGKLAEAEGVKIVDFKVIYDLLDYVDKEASARKKKITGQAQILAEFPFNGKLVAGIKVTQGALKRSDELTLSRGDKELGKARIASMRKLKDEVSQLAQGEEGGVLLSPQLDFVRGDVLTSSTKVK